MLHAGHVPDAADRRPRRADLPDHLLRLRRRRHRRAALRAQAVRQHLHPDRQSDDRRARGAARVARERHRRRGRGERHGRAVRGADDAALAGRRDRGLLAPLRRDRHPAHPHFSQALDQRPVRRPDAARATGKQAITPAHPRALRRDGRQPAGQHPRPRAARGTRRSGTGSRSSSTTPSRRPISAGRWTGAPRSSSTPRPSSSAAMATASAGRCWNRAGSTTAMCRPSRTRRPRITASGSSTPSATTAS